MIIDKNNYSIEHFHNSPQVVLEHKKSLKRRLAHLDRALEYVQKTNGAILEFGVFKGSTITRIAEYFPKDIVHGFDSFEGLPENWDVGHKVIAGSEFDRHGQLPVVPDNVKLWVGWFDETLPKYLRDYNNEIKLLHVDCDLYSSTVTVLESLNPFIVEGTIIILDDFYPWGKVGYDTWEEGEYKALKEWITKYDRAFTVLLHNNHQQCTIRIEK